MYNWGSVFGCSPFTFAGQSVWIVLLLYIRRRQIMTFNAMTEHYEEITVCGKPALFTSIRIKRDTVPDGLYAYDVQHDDECQDIPCEIAPFAMVNHWSTIILPCHLWCKHSFLIHGTLNTKNTIHRRHRMICISSNNILFERSIGFCIIIIYLLIELHAILIILREVEFLSNGILRSDWKFYTTLKKRSKMMIRL